MLRRLRFLLLYFVAWLIFFEFCRVFFILYVWRYTSITPRKDLFLSLCHGLKMDMSMSSYITIPVALFLILSVFIHFFRRRLIYNIYTAIILFILIVIVMVDVEIFRAWGHRADATPL